MTATYLDRAREAYERRAWLDAYEAFSRADAESPSALDLELLAFSASMVGRVDDYGALLERRITRTSTRAKRCRRRAQPLDRHEPGGSRRDRPLAAGSGSTGWSSVRAQTASSAACSSCRSHFSSRVQETTTRRSPPSAAPVEVADAFRNADLFAAATYFQGWSRIKQGRCEGLEAPRRGDGRCHRGRGLAFPDRRRLLRRDRVLRGAFDARRAREWTNALSRWCEQQPQLVSFTGRCLSHRAGILQLHGAWAEALAEAQLARVRCEESMNRPATGQALYSAGRAPAPAGRFRRVERAYLTRTGTAANHSRAWPCLARAGRPGSGVRRHPTRPGGNEDSASACSLLPARAEIALARGEVEEARRASAELEQIAVTAGSAQLGAMAAQVRGEVELAAGDAEAALVSARRAWQTYGGSSRLLPVDADACARRPSVRGPRRSRRRGSRVRGRTAGF